MTNSQPVLILENVSINFGHHKVLQNISLQANLGEFIYLVGKTGSGKSTLLKLIYADCVFQSGTGQFDSFHLHKLSRKDVPFLRRKLGIIFQDFQLLPDRTVNENIHFALKATGWKNKARIKEKLNEVLIQVGMSGKGRSLPHQLSGGEQQRVAIARAMINDPLLLVADEPTGNLDPDASIQIMELLLKINQGGTAVLMATHEYPLINKYPSRIIEVDNHQLVEYTDPRLFLEQNPYMKGEVGI